METVRAPHAEGTPPPSGRSSRAAAPEKAESASARGRRVKSNSLFAPTFPNGALLARSRVLEPALRGATNAAAAACVTV